MDLYAYSYTELILMDFTDMDVTVKEIQICIECQLLYHSLLFLKQLKPWS